MWRGQVTWPLVLAALVAVIGASGAIADDVGCDGDGDSNATTIRHHEGVTKLTLVQFNAEWLFDGQDDPKMSPWYPGKTSCPGMDRCGTREGAEAHIKRVGDFLATLDADVLSLNEVENCGVLRRVIELIGGKNSLKPYLIKGVDTATRQNVALISKYAPTRALERLSDLHPYPVEGSQCQYTSTKERRSTLSKNYKAELDINGMLIHVYAAHLKAFPTDPYSCAKREAQAKVLQAGVRASLDAGREVIVLGDLNDYSYAYLDAAGDVPTSRVLRILRDVDGDGTDELVNTIRWVHRSDRFTSWYDR